MQPCEKCNRDAVKAAPGPERIGDDGAPVDLMCSACGHQQGT